MSRDVVIVGHGRSAVGAGLGKEIDKHKRIVRLKVASEETLRNPTDYGTRRDILCGSWKIKDYLHNLIADEYWVFLDSRNTLVRSYEITNELTRSIVMPEICRKWTEWYVKARVPTWEQSSLQIKSPVYSDSLGHVHFSTGSYALVYAAHILRPKSISLVGYDNVLSGSFSKSVTRRGNWSKYPDHRWDTENLLMKEIAKEYNVEIRSI